MSQIQNCCCCVTLKTGSVIIGVVTLTMSLIFIVLSSLLVHQEALPLYIVREGFKKKEICVNLHTWVGQEWDKLHKKTKENMPLKSILDHFKLF